MFFTRLKILMHSPNIFLLQEPALFIHLGEEKWTTDRLCYLDYLAPAQTKGPTIIYPIPTHCHSQSTSILPTLHWLVSFWEYTFNTRILGWSGPNRFRAALCWWAAKFEIAGFHTQLLINIRDAWTVFWKIVQSMSFVCPLCLYIYWVEWSIV